MNDAPRHQRRFYRRQVAEWGLLALLLVLPVALFAICLPSVSRSYPDPVATVVITAIRTVAPVTATAIAVVTPLVIDPPASPTAVPTSTTMPLPQMPIAGRGGLLGGSEP